MGLEIIAKEDFRQVLEDNKHHIKQLEMLVLDSGEPLEGNSMYKHHSMERISALTLKQRNIYSLAAAARRSGTIMEIGFNAGHSSLLMLLANPDATIVLFDLCEHRYTMPCYNYLNEAFGKRLLMIPGNSTETVPRLARACPSLDADLYHIDGSHQRDVAHEDFVNCQAMARHGAYVIYDDTQMCHIKKLWDEFVNQGFVWLEQSALQTRYYQHGVGQFIKEN